VCAKPSICSAQSHARVRSGAGRRSGRYHGADGDTSTPRVDRSSVEGWLVAGGKPGSPLTSRNA
jgi:hypothetical protein